MYNIPIDSYVCICIRKPHSNCSSDGIPKIIMTRHVLIDLRVLFNGWAYWTHYEKKMNMSIQDSDGGTCASSEDMTQDEFDEIFIDESCYATSITHARSGQSQLDDTMTTKMAKMGA